MPNPAFKVLLRSRNGEEGIWNAIQVRYAGHGMFTRCSQITYMRQTWTMASRNEVSSVVENISQIGDKMCQKLGT